jgi:hypothetical protein
MPAAVGLFCGPRNGAESLVRSGLEQGKQPGSNILCFGGSSTCTSDQVARDLAVADGAPGGNLVAADVDGDRAAGVEATARGRIGGAGDLAGQRYPGLGALHRGVGFRDGGEQSLGVGVVRLRVERVAWRPLGQPAEVHHRHTITGVENDGEIVADEQRGRTVPDSSATYRFSICARTDTSSAETGSSNTSSAGCRASAWAIRIRWRCPPLN